MTNGIVSVTRNGKTVVKAIAGCNGMKADHLAEVIRSRGLTDVAEIYVEALDIKFGCMGCLVVQGADETIFLGEDELGPLYAENFADPRFNPRWDSGTASYVVVVERE